MPQKLKEEVRQRILQAALEQMLKCGEAATMRQIAKAADVTPGNLYRYYEGKEELVDAIIHPLVAGMNEVLGSATGQALTLGQTELPPLPDESPDQLIEKEFYPLMRKVLIQTVALCREHPKQAAVLLQMESVGNRLIGWFREIMDQALARLTVPGSRDKKSIELLADAECQAFCTGVRNLLMHCGELSAEDAQALVESFLYLHMQGVLDLLRRGVASGAIQLREENLHA